jgi:hypothetical protein
MTAQQATLQEALDYLNEHMDMEETSHIFQKELAKVMAGFALTCLDAPTAGDGVTFNKSDWEGAKQSIGNLNYQGLINIDDLVKIIARLEDKVGYPAPQNAAGDNWISVGERLPEPDKMVLVYCPNESNDCGQKFTIRSDFMFMSAAETYSWDFSMEEDKWTCTHWRELPSPPTATAEQDKKR